MTHQRPFLLITNDDGISAPGIRHLWEAVRDFADVAIVAPLSEKSGTGLSITWAKPLRIQPFVWDENTQHGASAEPPPTASKWPAASS